MNHEENHAERQRRDFEYVQTEFVEPRLQRAEKIYGQATTSLWLGNAGAALATLSFIGATWQKGSFLHLLLWPLFFFIAGLMAMGAGALASLVKEARVLRKLEEANSVWDMKLGTAQRPTESAGLSLGDWRTRMALASAVLFVCGCAAGFVLLACNGGGTTTP